MAIIVPDGWREFAASARPAPLQREIETLAMLADALPDAYTVYHAVHWTRLEQGYSVYGEIDFVVVNQAGALLLIEQKSGFLEEGADGLKKRYAGRPRACRSRWRAAWPRCRASCTPAQVAATCIWKACCTARITRSNRSQPQARA
jgi:hypothetical protein